MILRNRHFLYVDIVIFLVTPVLALYLRIDDINALLEYQFEMKIVVLLFMANKLVHFYFGGIYNRMWQHASIDELARLIIVGLLVTVSQTVLYIGITNLFFPFHKIPHSIPIIDGILTILLVSGFRFSIRLSERFYDRLTNGKQQGKPVLIVGAGDAGIMIAEELQSNPQMELMPVGFVDDDTEKHMLKIRGLTVLGDTKDIPHLVDSLNISEIIIAIPTATGKVIREIISICQTTGAKIKTIPGIYELLNGSVRVSKLRDVAIEDLLQRKTITADMSMLLALIKGKKVLVTGGGGSIGSELCRQISRYQPAQLVIVGHGENSIFTIANELSVTYPDLKFSPVIADIREARRVNKIFARFKPDIVYHAAAHKHVPLMESNPSEAVANNIIGTYNVVKAALDFGTTKFVQISTDKAVNPTNIMGATKRVAERVILDASLTSGRSFVAVRFGNVLGSRGSVVPTFREQIARGGPVTITHPDVKRYFMTIPEAVQLVLFSSVIGKGGELFVLDMGEPVKIADLAKDLIRLSGHKSQKEIEIIYTGLRPGEKLFEELVLSGECFDTTTHPKIFVVKNEPVGSKNKFTKHAPEQYLKNILPSIVEAKLLITKGNEADIGKYLERHVEGFKYIGGVEAI